MNIEQPILVAIHCLVYNHEPYLRDCFEGFIKQKTNFRFAAIVHDDCSTDESASIIHEYAEKFPDIIKPIYETDNQYKKGGFGLINVIMGNAIDATEAKYVALCEGDDYWTDPYKLQKQIDILEADETLMACCTDCSVVDNHGVVIKEKRGGVVKDDIAGQYNLRDFFRDNHQYPTLSVVYRNTHAKEVREKHAHTANAFLGDWTMWICLMIYGDMYFLNEVTCAYRINPTSVTHTVNRVERAKANRDICPKVADILPEEYADIAEDLRDTRWVWIALVHAYKAEKRYLWMIGSLIMALMLCPGASMRMIVNYCKSDKRKLKIYEQ